MKKWKKGLIIGGAIVVVGVIVYASVQMSRQGVVTVQTGKVAKQDLVSIVTASGEVKPLLYVNVGSTAYGQITEIAVKEGDRVKRGQLLARLESVQPTADVAAQQANLKAAGSDTTTAEAAATSAAAALRTAEADVPRAKAELERARLDFERSTQMLKQGVIAESALETSRATYEVARASLEAANARVLQSKAQLEQAQSQLESTRSHIAQYQATLARASDVLRKTNFEAPIDGVVTNLPVHRGETMVAGIQNSPGSLLMTIADMSVITTEVKVDETDIVNVKLGQPADITIDAIPDKTFKGHVTEIGNSAIIRSTGLATSSSNVASQEAKDFKVVITLDAPPENLRPGLSSTAKVQTASKNSALAIPIQALTIRQKGELEEPKKEKAAGGAALAAGPDAREKEKEAKKEIQGVFVVRNKKAVFVPVETGITGTTDIEVTSGLKEGDEIVTGSYSVLRTIRNNAPVKVDNKAPQKAAEEGTK
jgi:HlyD family secretion protein